MSRLFLAASLITALTSFASADRAYEPNQRVAPPTAQHWAQPPGAGARAELPMPQRMLDRATVRAKLAANRAANLARFRVYQKRGVFPSNTYSPNKLNVWLDEDGHFCAAATIIKASGQDALVDRVAEQSNFIRLSEVRQGPLMDWILTSGLTQSEIAAIQEPMMPISTHPRMQPDPADPVTVDAAMRKREDQRLLAKYRRVEAKIMKDEKQSLDFAVDHLMKHPDLAWSLIDLSDAPS